MSSARPIFDAGCCNPQHCDAATVFCAPCIYSAAFFGERNYLSLKNCLFSPITLFAGPVIAMVVRCNETTVNSLVKAENCLWYDLCCPWCQACTMKAYIDTK